MVVDALLSNIVASALMNGLCCVHSMQEEEARRKEHQDFMRKTIHVEWERQRVIERELFEKELNEQGLSDAAVVAEARRRLLIATKVQAKKSCSVGGMDARHNHSSRHDDYQYTISHEGQQRRSIASPKSIVPPSSINNRISSAPVWCLRDTEVDRSASGVSSLFDEDEDDEDMEEISLRYV